MESCEAFHDRQIRISDKVIAITWKTNTRDIRETVNNILFQELFEWLVALQRAVMQIILGIGFPRMFLKAMDFRNDSTSMTMESDL